ncbi:MAG TPA: PLP-dependent aminotransferase family protein [Gemmatimonadales bacterium]|nr:PLP-dependent aminotransferase family protein [Gemmatimonadales bacterium]
MSRARVSDAPFVLVPLVPGDARPLHQQVYEALRSAILAGRLRPGARVPSSRALAADLGIARNTVLLAYDQLRFEGYLVGRRGGGTRVHETIPDRALAVRPAASRAAPVARGTAGGTAGGTAHGTAHGVAHGAGAAPSRGIGARGRALAAASAERTTGPAVARPFRLGLPAVDAFPAALWARLDARRWRTRDVLLAMGDPAGEAALRAAIADYVTHARSARCTAEQVLVTTGAQQAFDLCARVLLDPGDAVWMEDPGYEAVRGVFAAAGARLVPVPVDDEGLDVAAGIGAAPAARLAYVTPSHQFPLGSVMSLGRRLALLAWARRAGAWLLEDDYDSEFRYAGRPLPCLQGLDAEGDCVLYVGTFNKTLVPGLRLGYLIVPAALVDAFRAARAVTDGYVSGFLQGALADFLGGGHYARHLRRMRTLYHERQQALLAAATGLAGRLDLAPSATGLHLVGRLPAGTDDVAVAAAARGEGVDAYPLSPFYHDPRRAPYPGLVLGYAGFDPRALRAGVRRLARALDAVGVERPPHPAA